jgi:hypothetical protein
VQNLSINGRVFFLEEGHKYYEDDAQDNTVLPFENSKYAFRSPTGLIKDFHEEFDTIPEAKSVIRHKLSITWEQLVLPGTCLGIWLLLRTTLLR